MCLCDNIEGDRETDSFASIAMGVQGFIFEPLQWADLWGEKNNVLYMESLRD